MSNTVDCSWEGCDREFKNEYGMKIHHSQIHGESIAGIEFECDYCGKVSRRPQSRLELYEHNFCEGTDCQEKWLSEYNSGENNPCWKDATIKFECSWCGDTNEDYRSTVEPFENSFCRDNDCRRQWMSENMCGENHPSWDGGFLDFECAYCGNIGQIKRYKFHMYEKHFCRNSDCQGKWISENNRGENNPRWTGGRGRRYYGSTWIHRREERLEEDGYMCVECGMTDEEHREEYANGLHVHHLIKVRKFDNPDYAHFMDNLRTLCHQHHCEWESMSL